MIRLRTILAVAVLPFTVVADMARKAFWRLTQVFFGKPRRGDDGSTD